MDGAGPGRWMDFARSVNVMEVFQSMNALDRFAVRVANDDWWKHRRPREDTGKAGKATISEAQSTLENRVAVLEDEVKRLSLQLANGLPSEEICQFVDLLGVQAKQKYFEFDQRCIQLEIAEQLLRHKVQDLDRTPA